MPQYPEVCYEIFVRSFCDSDGDGIGDLNGITSKLGYLSELGIRGIWLTPVLPSPSYHKYDVADYYDIDPEYGTLDDFRNLLKEAHSYGIQVYMDLVIHHTSIIHPWFREAKGSPGSPYRPYYRWMPDREIARMGLEVRELTQDAHTVNPWHRVKGDKERFLGVFSPEMADLNFDHETLKEEIYGIVAFWLNEIGVDGFRLDAARHIYPPWEDDRNPVFWEEFGRRIEGIRPDTYLVGEVWAETEKVAPFFKGLKANFNFDLCRRIEQVLLAEERLDLIAWIRHQRRIFGEVSPGYIDATMLSNHDQQRIGSTLRGNIARMKLAAAILLTLPGQPYLYYGEEIGMQGRKPDPFLREPFLWGDDACQTTWMSPRHSRPGKVQPLESALGDPFSLYYCYKALIHLRNTFSAIGAVSDTGIRDVPLADPGLLAYVRRDEDAAFLVIHNLGRGTKNIPLEGEPASFVTVRYASTAQFLFKKEVLVLGGYNSIVLQQGPGGDKS